MTWGQMGAALLLQLFLPLGLFAQSFDNLLCDDDLLLGPVRRTTPTLAVVVFFSLRYDFALHCVHK